MHHGGTVLSEKCNESYFCLLSRNGLSGDQIMGLSLTWVSLNLYRLSDWLLTVFLSSSEAGLNWIKGHAVCVSVYTLCYEA